MPSTPTIAAARTRRRSPLRRALAAVWALIISLASVLGLALPASAHDVLVDTRLTAGATTSDPATLTLTFNNSVIEVGTEILLTGKDGKDIKLDAAQVTGTDVAQQLPASLPAGDYQVAWRVVSSDGHPIEGTLWFTRSDAGEYLLLSEAPAGFAAADGAASTSSGSGTSGSSGSSSEGTADEAGSGGEQAAAAGPSLPVILLLAGGGVVVIALAALVGVRMNRRSK